MFSVTVLINVGLCMHVVDYYMIYKQINLCIQNIA